MADTNKVKPVNDETQVADKAKKERLKRAGTIMDKTSKEYRRLFDLDESGHADAIEEIMMKYDTDGSATFHPHEVKLIVQDLKKQEGATKGFLMAAIALLVVIVVQSGIMAAITYGVVEGSKESHVTGGYMKTTTGTPVTVAQPKAQTSLWDLTGASPKVLSELKSLNFQVDASSDDRFDDNVATFSVKISSSLRPQSPGLLMLGTPEGHQIFIDSNAQEATMTTSWDETFSIYVPTKHAKRVSNQQRLEEGRRRHLDTSDGTLETERDVIEIAFDTQCFKKKWIGDGWCDNGNNFPACGWDGGDCCGDNVKIKYCKDDEAFDVSDRCKCKDPAAYDYIKTHCTKTCPKKRHIGDGYCDDENNNCACGYDGGDCCDGDNKGKITKFKPNKAFCTECSCVDPEYATCTKHDGCDVTKCSSCACEEDEYGNEDYAGTRAWPLLSMPGKRANSCWVACGGTSGFCSACDPPHGNARGACCKKGAKNQNADECKMDGVKLQNSHEWRCVLIYPTDMCHAATGAVENAAAIADSNAAAFVEELYGTSQYLTAVEAANCAAGAACANTGAAAVDFGATSGEVLAQLQGLATDTPTLAAGDAAYLYQDTGTQLYYTDDAMLTTGATIDTAVCTGNAGMQCTGAANEALSAATTDAAAVPLPGASSNTYYCPNFGDYFQSGACQICYPPSAEIGECSETVCTQDDQTNNHCECNDTGGTTSCWLVMQASASRRS